MLQFFTKKHSLLFLQFLFGHLLIGSMLDPVKIKKVGLVADTLIHTNTGYAPIKELKAKDSLYSFDFLTFALFHDIILKKHSTVSDVVIQLQIKDKIIFVGPDHKFYVINQQKWVKAKDLTQNDVIKTSTDSVLVDEVKLIQKKELLYCLSVKKNHNFLISDDDIVAHNMSLNWLESALHGIKNYLSNGAVIHATAFDMQSTIVESIQEQLKQTKADVERKRAEAERCDYILINPGQPTQSVVIRQSEYERNYSASPNLNTDINRHIQSLDRYKPGQSRCSTLSEINDRQRREAEEKTKIENNFKKYPYKTVTIEKVERGYLWNTTKKVTYRQVVPEEEYRANYKNPIQKSENGDEKTTIVYELPSESKLAKDLAREEQMQFLPSDFKNITSVTELAKEKKGNVDEPKEDREQGAQAPGKPTEADGYYPPKKWDGKKVKMTNGPLAGKYGWPDREGRIWVPTGPKGAPMAHGGPHWDVAYPDGKKPVNVYPGGKIREHKREVEQEKTKESKFYYETTNNDSSYSEEPYTKREEVLVEIIERQRNAQVEQQRDQAWFDSLTKEEKKEMLPQLNEVIKDIPEKKSETEDDSQKTPRERALEEIIEQQEKAINKEPTTIETVIELSDEEKKESLHDLNEILSPRTEKKQ